MATEKLDSGGDIVYDSNSLPATRGELVAFLCDAIEVVAGPSLKTTRLSNGHVADTLLICLDMIVTTEPQRVALREWLNEVGTDTSSNRD